VSTALARTPLVLSAATYEGDVEAIERFAPAWRLLCAKGVQDEPFYRPEWIAAYLRSFERHSRVKLFTASAGDELRAVLPMVESKRLLGLLPARVLRSPSNIYTCRFDLVHGCGDGDASLSSLWQEVKRDSWDALHFAFVPENGAIDRLCRMAAQDGFRVALWPKFLSPCIDMKGVTDPLQLCQRAHFRQNLRRRIRKASSQWNVTLERCNQATPEALERFYRVEASGWKGQERSALLYDEAARRFYEDAARAAAKQDYLALYFLYFDGNPVAAHYGLFYNGRYLIPKIGYDERYAAVGPGHLMIDAVLRDCLARETREFDFCGSSMPWKMEWTSMARAHNDYFIFRDNIAGRALQIGVCGLRKMARVREHLRARIRPPRVQ
jgi:CelD/BcsL family acetyltransferase involved in cellulose biosynthesis